MKILKAALFELSAALIAFILVFYSFCFLKASFAYAATPTVLVEVDGDTVKSSRTVYRLQHYDTPEINHALCDKEKQLGLQAKTKMHDLLAQNNYHVVSTGKKDKYGRTLATLYIGKTPTDQIFINAGLASPYEGKGPKKDWCK